MKVLSVESTPWAKHYPVDYATVKSNLKMTKFRGEQLADETTDYHSLFMDHGSGVSKRRRFFSAQNSRKILVKGITGVGKTILSKKIARDWAEDKFKLYDVVFYIDANINPGEAFGNMLMEQSGLTQLEIRHLFKHKSETCLIVLDGYDSSSSSESILGVIKQENVNMVVTCSIVESKDTEEHFDTVSSLQGFLGEQRKQFLSCDLKVSVPQPFTTQPEESKPMLTVFIHILSSNNMLEGKTESISLCEVYFKMVRLLCTSQDDNEFLQLIKVLGKLASDDLPSRKGFIAAEVNSDYIATGLVLKHSDDNSLISFANGPFEVFLAALYLVLMLNDYATCYVDSLISYEFANSVLLRNPLFVYYCLSLLGDQKYFPLSRKEGALERLKFYAASHFDLVQADYHDLAEFFPVFDVSPEQNKVVSQFMSKVLSSCKKTEELIFGPTMLAYRLLMSEDIVLPNIKCFYLTHAHTGMQIDQLNDQGIQLIIDNQEGQYVDGMLKLMERAERPFSIYFKGGEYSKPMVDFSMFARPNVHKVHISHNGQVEGTDNRCYVLAKTDIPHCPRLTQIEMTASHPSSIKLTWGFVSALSTAIQNGKLPNLSLLGLTGNAICGELGPLFRCSWPALTHLKLHHMPIENSSVLSFYGKILPNLKHLETIANWLNFHYCDQPLTKLLSLRIDGGDCTTQSNFIEAIQRGIFPKLMDLQILSPMRDIQMFSDDLWKLPSLCMFSYHGHHGAFIREPDPPFGKFECLELHKVQMDGILPSLFFEIKGLPYLERLVLIDCRLCIFDVRCLAQASAEGFLKALKHLDLSRNNQISGSKYLFDMNCKWENLKNLKIEGEAEPLAEQFGDFLFLMQKVSADCLGSLEELTFSPTSPTYTEKVPKLQWPSLKRLNISSDRLNWQEILSPLADLIDGEKGSDARGALVSLESVTVCLPNSAPVCAASERHRLRRKGIRLYLPTDKI